jgi:hypothetical protein
MEERIMIVADEPYYCNSCKKINNCSKDCKGYIQWFNRPDPIRHFYSKSEAIEKMAKAIKSVPKASGEAVHSTDYAKWAEAALNALLEKGDTQ